jgi:hypothetical protein
MPRGIVAYVEKLNDLRNAVAHSFFPENLRGIRRTYRGIDIFTIDGFSKLREDREPVVDFLMRRAFGIR